MNEPQGMPAEPTRQVKLTEAEALEREAIMATRNWLKAESINIELLGERNERRAREFDGKVQARIAAEEAAAKAAEDAKQVAPVGTAEVVELHAGGPAPAAA